MIEQGNFFFVYVFMVLITLAVFSIIIPLGGFFLKKWRGLAMGCFIQPLFLVLFAVLIIFGATLCWKYDLTRHEKGAMVVLKKVFNEDPENMEVNTWYRQDDGECFCDFGEREMTGVEFVMYGTMRFYDVVPMDSFRVCVDDKVIVKFDMEKRTATATEYEDTLEVVSVDWDKVNAYFQK